MSQKKKVEQQSADARRNKRAFDQVMLRFRRMQRPLLGAAGVINPQRIATASQRNPVKPSLLEFWNDVLVAIRAAKPKAVPLSKFITAYFLFDDDSELVRNTFAAKVVGARIHSCEQRVGAEFVRRGIWPIHKYMNPPRPC